MRAGTELLNSSSTHRAPAVHTAAAFAQLRPGGTLVYSTCSLEHMENEAIVEHFISHTPDAQIEEAHRSIPDDARVGRYVQTVPGQHLGDGAFAARIHKVKS